METETEVEGLIRECFDGDVLAGRRLFRRRRSLVPRPDELRPSSERPTLVLIRDG